MLFRGILIESARKVGACVIGLGVLWQVAERAGRGDGEAVIHVIETGVVVMIDGSTYPFDPTPGSPIVCPLRPGNHNLTVTRGGRIVHDETFHVESNGNAVLTAQDDTRPTLPQKYRSPSTKW